jgi:uncharacterized protein YecT (DUF1311 family)
MQNLTNHIKSFQPRWRQPEKKQLLDAQRAWLTFRELNCAFYDDADGGQAARVSAKDCFITMTAKRATELSNLMTNE